MYEDTFFKYGVHQLIRKRTIKRCSLFDNMGRNIKGTEAEEHLTLLESAEKTLWIQNHWS